MLVCNPLALSRAHIVQVVETLWRREKRPQSHVCASCCNKTLPKNLGTRIFTCVVLMLLVTWSSLFCTELRIFPDRFVVCVSQLAFGPDAWASQIEKSVCMKNIPCENLLSAK